MTSEFDRCMELGWRGPAYYSIPFGCSHGKARIRFETSAENLKAAFGFCRFDKVLERLLHDGPQVVGSLTKKVQIVVRTGNLKPDRRSAILKTEECVAILDGKWPNEENFSRILRAIADKKHYRDERYQNPGLGGVTTLGGQGQTKKPDAHSHKKHR